MHGDWDINQLYHDQKVSGTQDDPPEGAGPEKKDLARPPQPATTAQGDGCHRWFAGYVMSILLPAVGIALWLLLYTKDDPKHWRQSETFLVLAIVSGLVWIVILGAGPFRFLVPPM